MSIELLRENEESCKEGERNLESNGRRISEMRVAMNGMHFSIEDVGRRSVMDLV